MKRVLIPALMVLQILYAGQAGAYPDKEEKLLQAARKDIVRAHELIAAKRYREALPLIQRALQVQEPIVGPGDRDVLISLSHLLMIRMGLGQQSEAEKLLERFGEADRMTKEAEQLNESLTQIFSAGRYNEAAEIIAKELDLRRQVLGPMHPEVALVLNNQAVVFRKLGDYKKARQSHEEALAIQAARLDPKDPSLGITFGNLAELHRETGAYREAEPLYKKALQVLTGGLGPESPHVLITMGNLAEFYQTIGAYDKAEELLQRILGIHRRIKREDADTANWLSVLSGVYVRKGQLKQGLKTSEQALAIREKVFGPTHLDVAESLSNLATIHLEFGSYKEAISGYEKALGIRRNSLGPKHPLIAFSLTNLSTVQQILGAYGKAEELLRNALEIQEAGLGPQHIEVATTLNALGFLYSTLGMHKKAEPLFKRALSIFEASLGAEHIHVVTVLVNLANNYQNQGLSGVALPLLERAHKICNAKFAPSHPVFLHTLNLLAVVMTELGRPAEAEQPLLWAKEATQQTLRADHPVAAILEHNLATIYEATGQHIKAETAYRNAIAILKKVTGGTSPDLAKVLRGLAVLLQVEHKDQEALSLLSQMINVDEGVLQATTAETRLTYAIQGMRHHDDEIYSYVWRHPELPSAQQLAVATVLLHKNRSFEEGSQIEKALRENLSQPEDRARYEQLLLLRSQLSSMYWGDASKPGYAQAVHRVTEESDALEQSLAQRVAAFRQLRLPSVSEVIERVAEAIPQDGVLIEVLAFRPRNLTARKDEEVWEPLRYLALVLFPDRRIQIIDLGPSEPIVAAIMRFLESVRRPTSGEAEYLAAAQALHRLLILPLRPMLDAAAHPTLALDGQLSLLPLMALHDGQQFLLDRYHLDLISTGRDLLKRRAKDRPSSSVVVFADPDFSVPRTQAAPAQLIGEPPSPADLFSAQLRQVRALPGTRAEAKMLQRRLPQAEIFLGAQASETALRQLRSPGILHIATHGLFLEGSAAVPLETRKAELVGVGLMSGEHAARSATSLPELLSRSALLFVAGQPPAAVTHTSQEADGLVTAWEAAGLNLSRTQLVVLSACETGQGLASIGQGVYGLRRAFLLAGAETVVSSLWRISDAQTVDLMDEFYKQLLAGQRRGTAMELAAQEMKKKYRHPYYWAPFLVVGQAERLRMQSTGASRTQDVHP